MPTNYETILGTLVSGEDVPLLQADRRRHVYLIGMTGTGKTGLLLNMMHADLLSGAGFCFLDPHGDACQHIASLAPKERSKDVIYLDPSDPTHTFAYNPLSSVAEAERATAAANIVSAFKNIWAQSWGPRLEYILGHSLRLLLDTKDQTLLGLPRLLVDETYRDWLVVRCNDPVVRSFWQSEYAAYDTRLRNEAIAPNSKQDRRIPRQPIHQINLVSEFLDAQNPRRDEQGQSAHRQSLERQSRHRARTPSRRAAHHRVRTSGRGAAADARG